MKILKLEFVEFIPEALDEGLLYVSMKYSAARHKCACGCGNIVITPLSPNHWQLKYDGKSISLSPSIGNWSFPCQSHYWISKNEIHWAEKWTEEEISNGRKREHEKLTSKNQYQKQPKKKRHLKNLKEFLKNLQLWHLT